LISYEVAIFGLAVCVGLYAIFGGSRAVVWTDTIQGFILAALLIVTAALVVSWAGGWEIGWSRAIETQPVKFAFSEDTSSGKYITLMLLWTFGWVLTPHLWQRLYMANSPRTLVASSLIASGLALFVVTFSGAVIGFLAIGMNLDLPETFTTDALVPLLYGSFLPVMGAVLVVAVFAAGMSTLDSQIISASSSFVRDLYTPRRNVGDSARQMRSGRYFETAFVVAVVLFSLSAAGRQLLIPLASIGVGMALVFLMPLLGALFWPRATEPAAFWSILAGWATMLAMQFGLFTLPTSAGPALWGFVVSVAAFYLVSFATSPVSVEKQILFHGEMAQHFPETREAAAERIAL
jgi:SSS family solute:Na+ symporter